MANIHGISGVDRQQFHFQTLSLEQLERRISLFTGDSMEAERKIEVRHGEIIALPAFDPSQKQQTVSVFKDATPEQRTRLAEAGNQVFQGLVSHAEALQAGGTARPDQHLTSAVRYAGEQYMATRGEADVGQALNGVMEVAIHSAETDLYGFADDLQKNLDDKKSMRADIAELRDQIGAADWSKADPDGKLTFEVPDGKGGHTIEHLTKDEANKRLEDMQGKLDTLGDMTQMAQMKLQDALNKQAQAIQLMSAIMKEMHDTLKGVIGNMRG